MPKQIFKEILAIILTALTATALYLILWLISFLLSLNAEFIPLIRYIFNTLLVTSITWAAYGIYLIIASRFWIIGLVLGFLGFLSTNIAAIPNYIIMSEMGLISTIASVLEPTILSLAVIIVSILIKITKNRKLSFFIGLGIMSISHLLINLQRDILANIFNLIICCIPVGIYFIEKTLNKILLHEFVKTQDTRPTNIT